MALTIEINDRFTCRHVARDSHSFNVIKLRCPICGTYADVDQDQWHGRVSVECATPGCTFHETHNFAQLERAALCEGDDGGPYVEAYKLGPGVGSNADRAGGEAHGKSSPAQAVVNSPDQTA